MLNLLVTLLAQDPPTSLWEYVIKVGGPLGLTLTVLLYAIYKGSRHVWDNFIIARLWDQLIIPLRDKHFKFLETQTTTSEKNTGTLTELANATRQLVGLQEKQAEAQTKFTNDFDRWTRNQDEKLARLTTLAENSNTIEQMKSRTQDKTVLVVDDDAAARAALKMYINATGGCGVLVAATGRQAIDILKASLIDILLLDIGIPAPDGNDVLRWIEANRREMPVLVITGDESTVAADVKDVPKRILCKPIDPIELVTVMRQELYAA